jgi:hypothetical protein
VHFISLQQSIFVLLLLFVVLLLEALQFDIVYLLQVLQSGLFV